MAMFCFGVAVVVHGVSVDVCWRLFVCECVKSGRGGKVFFGMNVCGGHVVLGEKCEWWVFVGVGGKCCNELFHFYKKKN